MDNASLQFVLFGLAFAAVSNLSRSSVWRSAVLLISSLVFLGLLAHSVTSVLPLLGFLVLGYVSVLLVGRGWSRAQVLCVVVIILIYAWLKKYTFLPENTFLSHPYLTLGLSYIFFRVLHLVIEAADQNTYRQMGVLPYLAYTLNFTTFVSGPIQRYDEFARDQFAAEPLPLNATVIGLQMQRIITGFFKVNVLAMLLKMFQADALAQLSQPLTPSIKLYAAFRLAVVYPFFLYANFSGYIDIVIALARLARLQLPENFDRPFSASSFLDFWNRWHITLSTWLKTYVYNPLLIVLMRLVSSRSMQSLLGVFCFFVTFFLIGIWHGRTSEFAFFGFLQGGGVAVNKIWQLWLTGRLGRKQYKVLAANPIYEAFGRGLTFAWFAFTLFWFWANWAQIATIFHALGPLEWAAVWLCIWLAATAILAVWEKVRATLLAVTSGGQPILTSSYSRVVYATALAVVAFVMTVLLSQPAPDIVYKAF